MKAIWNDQVIAESDNTVVVENNPYFPKESIKPGVFKSSDTHTTCPWKGLASYYTLDVDGKQNADAAWYYPDPKPAAANIKDSCCLLERRKNHGIMEQYDAIVIGAGQAGGPLAKKLAEAGKKTVIN